MTATRRLAAILAVDVVGYSRLMGEDEAARENLRVAQRIDNSFACQKHSQ
jgi:class 3 adenylate cyclase